MWICLGLKSEWCVSDFFVSYKKKVQKIMVMSCKQMKNYLIILSR